MRLLPALLLLSIACSSARERAARDLCELELRCNAETWSSQEQCEANVLRGYDEIEAEAQACVEPHEVFVRCMSELESCADLEDRAGSDETYACAAEEQAVFDCRLEAS